MLSLTRKVSPRGDRKKFLVIQMVPMETETEVLRDHLLFQGYFKLL